jgi:drug/metabolite transporter (DMT)-like permease
MPRTLTFLAFCAIYLIWGSRFLAIRMAVETTPPLFAASLRFCWDFAPRLALRWFC